MTNKELIILEKFLEKNKQTDFSHLKRCPFYGFGWMGTNLWYSQGNQCPNIPDYAPCQMEFHKLPVNFENCRFNGEINLEDWKNVKVYLGELIPGIKEGVSFPVWQEFIYKATKNQSQ